MIQVVNNRRLVRELVLQALYAHEFTQDPPPKLIEILKEYNIIQENMESYFRELLTKSITHQEDTKSEIIQRLHNWKWERVALVDRIILNMMVTEMKYMEDVPLKVSITEGVEIAKKYSTEESGAFVNGILDSVYHSLVHHEGS